MQITPYEAEHQNDRQVGAFGEQLVSQFNPQCGWTFAYNINPDIVGTTVTGTGAVTHSRPFAIASSGTTPGSTATDNTAFFVSGAFYEEDI